jgi:hypothetical protein
MFGLFEMYYSHVTYERFLSDLNEKTHVFLFFEKKTHGKLIGFSTIFGKEIPHIAPGVFLFSGDTVVHADYRGSKALQKSFVEFTIRCKLLSPVKPVYWMLMSKGVKTYIMLRRNFKTSYPNSHGPTPAHFDHLIKAFYHLKYSHCFQAEKGLVVFEEKVGAVKDTQETHAESILKNPDADYFFSRNPLWSEGQELACVAEIKFSDLLYHIFKFFIPILKNNR